MQQKEICSGVSVRMLAWSACSKAINSEEQPAKVDVYQMAIEIAHALVRVCM